MPSCSKRSPGFSDSTLATRALIRNRALTQLQPPQRTAIDAAKEQSLGSGRSLLPTDAPTRLGLPCLPAQSQIASHLRPPLRVGRRGHGIVALQFPPLAVLLRGQPVRRLKVTL